MTNELLLRGGTLVTASESYRADLLVRDGTIAAIGRDLRSPGDVRDVEGLLVMPGGIDTHVHLEHPIDRLGIVTADDFFTGTLAAACGGVTTIVDFALQRKGDSIRDAVERRKREAEARTVVDFGLHVILTDIRSDVLREIEWAVNEGIPSFKIYMTYADKRVDDAALLEVLEQTSAHGGLAYLHCENDCAVSHLVRSSLREERTAARFHASSRPPLVEAEATYRAICLAELTKAPITIAHVTSREALRHVERARRRGLPVTSETCPQYLLLTDACYTDSDEAAKFVCTPPIRGERHRRALWRGVERGVIQQVASDHAPFRFADQKIGPSDFTKIPNGVPGIETRLPLLFSEGVSRGRIDVHRFVELVSSNPARIFGLYPQKGTLAVGADADLVVMDPERELTLSHEALHHAVDYTPYEGTKVRGAVRLTVSRGEILVEDGEPVRPPEESRGRGRFTPRRLASVSRV